MDGLPIIGNLSMEIDVFSTIEGTITMDLTCAVRGMRVVGPTNGGYGLTIESIETEMGIDVSDVKVEVVDMVLPLPADAQVMA